jgi:hypothetical protein
MGYRAAVTSIEQLVDVGLGRYDMDTHLLAGAIESINNRVPACTTCADLCILADEAAALRACIRVCLDTADMGRAVGPIVSRRGATDTTVLVVDAASPRVARSRTRRPVRRPSTSQRRMPDVRR